MKHSNIHAFVWGIVFMTTMFDLFVTGERALSRMAIAFAVGFDIHHFFFHEGSD